MNYDSHENLNKLESILQKYRTKEFAPGLCNFDDDAEKIEIIIWTYPNCGT